MAPATSPPALLEATKNSTTAWQLSLQALFHHAKDRFPDVVWEVVGEGNDKGKGTEEVWGHKAIVYARAPPSFQARYFSFRPAPVASPVPYASSPVGTLPGQSSLSLSLGPDYPGVSRSPSPFRITSPTPSTAPGTLLRLPTSINPILFSNELEYLYTGKGFGEAFEFLFDTSESRDEGDAEENRVDKLRKDLVFMWRSRLYSDIRIALTGNFSSTNHESSTAVFSSHRFMLVSRSPYFQNQLVSWGGQQKSEEPPTITLPSPPFTPASLHFTLGFIYTGTLVFSHRTYDLDTAFHIMRSATYLSLDTLYDEIQARIVQEKAHGLFHAFLEFSEYEQITGGKWGTGGCRCRQCARRAPRILEFAISDDVKNPHLDRGARRALVGLFGEGWCTPEFAALPQKIRDNLLKGLSKRTTPMNIFSLLFAAQHALEKLESVIDTWADVSRDMVLNARKMIEEVVCTLCEECFEQPDWLEIMEADGARFEDAERVDCIMESVLRGLNEKNAAIVYQTLVSAILLRPHLTESDATMLSSTSQIRVQVEETRVEVIRWMRKRWMGIRQDGGFDTLEGWALKEISGELEVPVEDLVYPSPTASPKGPLTRSGLRPSLVKGDADSDTVSMHSLRASVLNRNAAKQGPSTSTPSHRESIKSSSSSIRSAAGSTHSVASRPNHAHLRVGRAPMGLRPDSKLTPSTSLSSNRTTLVSDTQSVKSTRKLAAARTPVNKEGMSNENGSGGRSLATSVASSVRSRGSTMRNAAGPSTLRIPSHTSRPTSGLSTTSDASTSFQTANSELHPNSAVSRSRKTSGASTTSTISVKTSTGPSPNMLRPRRPSTTSVASTLSSASKSKRLAPFEMPKLSPAAVGRSLPMTSTVSSISLGMTKKHPIRKTLVAEKKNPSLGKGIGHPVRSSSAATGDVKGKNKALESMHVSTPSQESTSTVKGVKRKGSSDTITKSTGVTTEATQPSPLNEEVLSYPRGATLEIGIPCIISSKRKRFRAYARYIGEVEGEAGPWVGVEVPVGESWAGEKLEGRDWNDGTWGGIRYFEIGGAGSEWDYGDDRAARRRRVDWVHNLGKEKGLKREGDQLSVERAKRMRSASPATSDISSSEARGLFVRPQQVLYVVDAVGADL